MTTERKAIGLTYKGCDSGVVVLDSADIVTLVSEAMESTSRTSRSMVPKKKVHGPLSKRMMKHAIKRRKQKKPPLLARVNQKRKRWFNVPKFDGVMT
jgi:hypothetical protein